VFVALTVKGLLSGDRLIRETASSLAFNLSLSQLHQTPDPAIEIVSALHQALTEESDFEVGKSGSSTSPLSSSAHRT